MVRVVESKLGGIIRLDDSQARLFLVDWRTELAVGLSVARAVIQRDRQGAEWGSFELARVTHLYLIEGNAVCPDEKFFQYLF